MTAIDLERARYNMIEQQIRPWEVLDQRVLDTFASVPREEYVPERYRRLAFADVRIPLGHGQTMMNPNVEGRLLQALAIEPDDSVLEVGTGSGFLTACLGQLGARVDSVDMFPEFIERARGLLRRHGVSNASLYSGDARLDWGSQLYDVIALTGALPKLPDSWRRRMAVGGRLFAVVGVEPAMEAVLVNRLGEQEWEQISLFETDLTYLIGYDKPSSFQF